MARFVLLIHDHPDVHWDFMLEVGGTLRTWRLSEMPDEAGTIRATRIGDHRIDYLDYEGSVSRNRGTVSRVDRGEFGWLENSDAAQEVRLVGDRLIGVVRLEHQDGDEWLARWTPEDQSAEG